MLRSTQSIQLFPLTPTCPPEPTPSFHPNPLFSSTSTTLPSQKLKLLQQILSITKQTPQILNQQIMDTFTKIIQDLTQLKLKFQQVIQLNQKELHQRSLKKQHFSTFASSKPTHPLSSHEIQHLQNAMRQEIEDRFPDLKQVIVSYLKTVSLKNQQMLSEISEYENMHDKTKRYSALTIVRNISEFDKMSTFKYIFLALDQVGKGKEKEKGGEVEKVEFSENNNIVRNICREKTEVFTLIGPCSSERKLRVVTLKMNNKNPHSKRLYLGLINKEQFVKSFSKQRKDKEFTLQSIQGLHMIGGDGLILNPNNHDQHDTFGNFQYGRDQQIQVTYIPQKHKVSFKNCSNGSSFTINIGMDEGREGEKKQGVEVQKKGKEKSRADKSLYYCVFSELSGDEWEIVDKV